jgi:hypothetical protein
MLARIRRKKPVVMSGSRGSIRGKMGLELNREGEYSLLGPGEDIAEFSGGAEMSEREMPGDILRDHMARVAGNNRI